MSENTTQVEVKRVVKAGGDKGKAIVEAMKADPNLTRSQVAEKVGATVGRVGEVVRFLAANGSKDEKAIIARHTKAQESKRAQALKEREAAKKAAAAARPTKTGSKSDKPSSEPVKKTRAPRGAAKKAATAPVAPVETQPEAPVSE